MESAHIYTWTKYTDQEREYTYEMSVNSGTLYNLQAIDLYVTSVVVLKEVQLACVLQVEQGAGH